MLPALLPMLPASAASAAKLAQHAKTASEKRFSQKKLQEPAGCTQGGSGNTQHVAPGVKPRVSAFVRPASWLACAQTAVGAMYPERQANATHGVSRVALVVPLHPPKFAWGCHLLSTAIDLRVIAVFSSEADRAEFRRQNSGRCGVAQHLRRSLVVPPVLTNAPVTKKLGALRVLFRSHPAYTHLIAVDAETEQHRAFAYSYIRRWEERRSVALWLPAREPVVEKVKTWYRTVVNRSCAAARLPPLPGYPWWADAPVFSRSDFAEFDARLDALQVVASKYFYEHVAYMCFKHFVKNWSIAVVPSIRCVRHTCDGGRTLSRGRGLSLSRAPSKRARSCSEGPLCGLPLLSEAHARSL